jgi:competence protein ComEC
VIAKYPALLFLLLLMGGLEIRENGAPLAAAFAGGALLFWGAALLYSFPQEPTLSLRSLGLFCLLLVGLGVLLFRFEHLPRGGEDLSTFAEKGRVVLERPWGGRWVHVVATSRGKILYRTFPREALKEGEELFLSGSLVPLGGKDSSRKKSSSSFDEGKYWGARGVFQEIREGEHTLLPKNRWSLAAWRSHLREELLLNFPPSLRGYLLAIWLGDRDPELGALHQAWGTAHLLAVSGFHVGLVALLLWWIFPPFFGRGRLPLISAGMWLYVLLAGGSPSALRAGLMAQILLLGRFLGYRGNVTNAVALGASLLLLWRPWWFWDLGWRLSVLASLGITLLGSLSWRAAFFGASPVAWSVTGAPLIEAFGAVPLGGLLLNFFVLPVYAFLLPLISLLGLCFFLPFPGGETLLWWGEGALGLWHHLMEQIAWILPLSFGNLEIASALGAFLLAFLVSINIPLSFSRRALSFFLSGGGMFFLYMG